MNAGILNSLFAFWILYFIIEPNLCYFWISLFKCCWKLCGEQKDQIKKNKRKYSKSSSGSSSSGDNSSTKKEKKLKKQRE